MEIFKKGAKLRYILGKDTVYKNLNPTSILNATTVSTSTKSLKLNFVNSDSIPFMG